MMGFAVLLSPPVIAGITIIAMLGLSVRSIRLYTHQAPEFRSRLKRLDRDLAKCNTPTAAKRKAVADLEHQLAPLQSKEAALRAYYEELRAIELEAEKKALARQQAEKPDLQVKVARQVEVKPKRKVEITLKKKGLE